MFFSQLLPLSLLALAPAAIAFPKVSSNPPALGPMCKATVQLYLPVIDNKSYFGIETGRSPFLSDYSDDYKQYCGRIQFQTPKPGQPSNLHPQDKENPGPDLSSPLVWYGECADGREKGLTGATIDYRDQKGIKAKCTNNGHGFGEKWEVKFKCG